jgi:hypothetical protein
VSSLGSTRSSASSKAGGDLGARRSRADDGQAGGQLGQRPGLLGADDAVAEVHAGDRAGGGAGREDDGGGAQQLIAHAHIPLGGQRGVAFDHVDGVFAEQAGHARGERRDDLVATGLDGRVVDLDAADLDAEVVSLADLRQQIGRAQNGLGRDAGVVEAASTDLVALDDNGLLAELGGTDRGDVAAGSGPDHDAVIGG